MGGKKCRTGDGADDVATPAGASSTATTIVVLVFLLLVASVVVFLLSPPPATRVDHGKGSREPVELAIGIVGHEGWLDALRVWAKLACLKLQPPEPRYDLKSPASVKKAAKESLEMGKETVEHAAESAARAAEETLEKTTEKMKRKVSPSARRLDGDL